MKLMFLYFYIRGLADLRLPTHMVPRHYTLSLVPFIYPGNFTIRGYVEIEMDCLESANNITLHVKDIKVENDTIRLLESGRKEIAISNYKYDLDREFFILYVNSGLVAGKTYLLKIHYTAYLRDNLKGFYRSVYQNKITGEEEFLAVTQFQPTDARSAFPCFDEPGIKATFQINIGRMKDMSSISNMPIVSSPLPIDCGSDYVWDRYKQSVKMSTYLVAFVVSKLQNIEMTRDDGLVLRIWADSNSIDQTGFAMKILPKILEHFEGFFNLKFPLPKIDMIAIPDFAYGAMENWGLITYTETALLYKEGVSSEDHKEQVATIVSHELAHQWFGNLVTPSWWTDLWLNEGFASYVEYLGVEAAVPELKLLEQFVIKETQNVFQIDALKSSHPISIPVKHPDEITQIFDRISYGKGAAIIRMMDKILTTPTFRQGLTNYLTDLQFGAAEQDDLWRHLTVQARRDGTLAKDMDVKRIMDTWTLQMGFPVVTITRNYKDNTAKITQQMFMIGNSNDTENQEDGKYSWWIPLTYTSPGSTFENSKPELWLAEGEQTKEIYGMPRSEIAVVFNIQQNGYYRVNYDKDNWNLLVNQLMKDHTDIHVINRAQIMDDALNLAKSDLLDYETTLSLAGYISREVEYIPWASTLHGLAYIDGMLKRTPAYEDFKRYMLKTLDPVYEKLGFNAQLEDTHLDVKLRGMAIGWVCGMDHEDCLYKAIQNFRKWMAAGDPDRENPVDVNLKFQTYCYAIAGGGEKEWDFAWQRYQNSSVASEKTTILAVLGCTKQVKLLEKYLAMTLTPDSGVRRQDAWRVIGSVALNTLGRDLAFKFVTERWRQFSAKGA